MNLGETIRKNRKKLKLSRVKLAKLSGVPYQTIDNLESGRVNNPYIDTVAKIAGILDMPLDLLYKMNKSRKMIDLPENIIEILKREKTKYFLTLITTANIEGISDIKDLCTFLLSIGEKFED
ncbi:MAG: helix-turn-helix transcriptional regulator [Syntrophobacterales bacterium]|nr:MAG: helix-turn-helix transcriptional regulator [Syntrophobacterales bacterium]